MANYKAGHKSVFGLFDTYGALEEAVEALKNDGFRSSEISALLPDKDGSRKFAHEKATKAPEGTAVGATSGAVVGAGLGWLAGIGALAIPGIGPFVAAGPIMAAIAGAGIAGTIGGITGALVGMGIPEYEAKRYEGYLKNGGMLLSVHVDNDREFKRAKEIFEAAGAKDIDSERERKIPVTKTDRLAI